MSRLPTFLLAAAKSSLLHWAGNFTIFLTSLTSALAVWTAYIGHIQRLSWRSQDGKCFVYGYGCTLRVDVWFSCLLSSLYQKWPAWHRVKALYKAQLIKFHNFSRGGGGAPGASSPTPALNTHAMTGWCCFVRQSCCRTTKEWTVACRRPVRGHWTSTGHGQRGSVSSTCCWCRSSCPSGAHCLTSGDRCASPSCRQLYDKLTRLTHYTTRVVIHW